MITLPIILSMITGFVLAEFLGGKAEGHPGKLKSVRIKVKEYTVHVHHWLYASAALVALPSTVDHKTAIEAFLVGVIMHGLTYRDFYKIIYKENPAIENVQ